MPRKKKAHGSMQSENASVRRSNDDDKLSLEDWLVVRAAKSHTKHMENVDGAMQLNEKVRALLSSNGCSDT
jgi:hypothetical protein